MSDTSGTDCADRQNTQNSVPATDNGSGEATTENSSGGAKGKRRITTQGKKELWLHFSGPPKYARNQRMPMANTNHALDAIISKHGLSRDQASRQLRNWKMETYELANVSVSASAEDVEIRIKDSISVSTEELVCELLTDICGHKQSQASASTCIIIERRMQDCTLHFTYRGRICFLFCTS